MTKISNSGHDERGRYNGGVAGDQGGEWSVINWYRRPWNVVFRHPNKKVAELIAKYAQNAANNNKIGYDQYQRTTFWSQLKGAKDYDPKNITKACEADCSAGVAAIVKAVGYKLGVQKLKAVSENMWTGNETAVLKGAGFTVLTSSKYTGQDSYLYPDDILCNTSHHTAINLTAGSKSGYTTYAQDQEAAKKKQEASKKPTQAKSPAKKTETQTAKKEPWKPGLKVDGVVGPATVKAWQRIMGTTQDGKITGQNSGNKKYHSAVKAIAYGSGGSELVKAVQKRLGVKTVNGQLNASTIKAIQKRVGATQDGDFGKNTAARLQKRLNAGIF